jgi:hypothetical protein
MLNEPYLEVTFRRGRAIAAYYYLPRRAGEKSYRTRKFGPGMVVDYSRTGRPIGTEVITPGKVKLATVNRVLRRLGFSALKRADLAPLIAA